MKLRIQLHLAGLSLSDTVTMLGKLGVQRHRSTVSKWVKKADLRPADGAEPDHVALDEAVIQINDEWFWLYAAVDPETSKLLHLKPSPARNDAITLMFVAELREKHHVDDTVFTSILQRAFTPYSTATASDFDMNAMEIERSRTCLLRGETANKIVIKCV